MFAKYSALNYWQGPAYIRKPSPYQTPVQNVQPYTQPQAALWGAPEDVAYDKADTQAKIDVFAPLEPYMRQPVAQTVADLASASLHQLTDLVSKTSNVAASLSNASPSAVDPFDLYNFIQWVSNLNSTTSKYMWDAAITVSTPPPPAAQEPPPVMPAPAMQAPAVQEPLPPFPPPPPPPAPQQPSSLWYIQEPVAPVAPVAPAPEEITSRSVAFAAFEPIAQIEPYTFSPLQPPQTPQPVQPLASPLQPPASPPPTRQQRSTTDSLHTVIGGSLHMTTSGNVGLGVSMPSHQLEMSKDEAIKPASFAWRIDADRRLMDDLALADLETCYANVKNMPLRTFKWKTDVYGDDQVNDRQMLGWTADDVIDIFPTSVVQRNAHDIGDCKSLDVSPIIASMHGALQKIQRLVEAQTERMDSLERQIPLAAPQPVPQLAPQPSTNQSDMDDLRDLTENHQLQLDSIKSEIIQLRRGIAARRV